MLRGRSLGMMQVLAQQLLEGASDEVCRARLLASAAKESGSWLHALPISSLGLRMDDNSVRIAVGLRLGVPICGPTRVITVGLRWMSWVIMPSVVGRVKGDTSAMQP